MVRRAALALLGCAGLAFAVGAWAGDIYRWTDADGQVHYGDRPTSRSAEPVQLRPEPPPDPQAAARRGQRDKFLRAMQEDKAARAKRQHKADRKAAHLAAQCRKARRHLQEYRRATYLYREDGSGGRKVLSDSQRAAAVKKLQAQIEQHCN